MLQVVNLYSFCTTALLTTNALPNITTHLGFNFVKQHHRSTTKSSKIKMLPSLSASQPSPTTHFAESLQSKPEVFASRKDCAIPSACASLPIMPDLVTLQPSSHSSRSKLDQRTTVNRTFELFPCLPAELQVAVWKVALPPPRCIQIEVCEQSTLSDRKGSFWVSQPQDEPSPAMLFDC